MQDSWNILYRTIYNCTDGAYPCQYKGCEVSDGKLSLCRYKKILARMYELGMTPVLPAFSGNVPAALKSVFPAAKIERLGNWKDGCPRLVCGSVTNMASFRAVLRCSLHMVYATQLCCKC
ncbi:uncharacterized protein LOC108196204 isoform X3 [Daucus carota subsp. sativus]|uniref:uncharacterized protein LOC108196204 isoform X3 n=1 Tax=Daucus carota subsp. sativus TaxID=79200 RepID=UPI0030828281